MKRDERIYNIIGGNIRSRRQFISMNQYELAKKVELTRSSIVQIESGKQAITLLTLYKVAEALGLSIYKLLPESISENDFDSYSSSRVMNKIRVLDILDKKAKEGTSC